jgi:hypothetical protein
VNSSQSAAPGPKHASGMLGDMKKNRGGKKKLSPAGVLARKRWAKTSKAERLEVGAKLAEARKAARLKRKDKNGSDGSGASETKGS